MVRSRTELAQPTLQPLASEPPAHRELEVLCLIAQGLALAEMMVCTHVSNILGKLHRRAKLRRTCMLCDKSGPPWTMLP